MKALNTDVVSKPVWAQASRVAGQIVMARKQEAVTIWWNPTIGHTFAEVPPAAEFATCDRDILIRYAGPE